MSLLSRYHELLAVFSRRRYAILAATVPLLVAVALLFGSYGASEALWSVAAVATIIAGSAPIVRFALRTFLAPVKATLHLIERRELQPALLDLVVARLRWFPLYVAALLAAICDIAAIGSPIVGNLISGEPTARNL
ncbi:MAG: hypothetical protein JO359_05100, partial [Candidatus Eremiobacteraeota bacterium]|nr:hypothetical protein [Candidatus Eremiobacteraeota bacterium]